MASDSEKFSYRARRLRFTNGRSATVLELAGAIDPDTMSEFATILMMTVKGDGSSLVADFTNLLYISPSGVDMFMRYARETEAAGGAVVVCGLSLMMRIMLKAVGCLPQLKVAPDQLRAAGMCIGGEKKTVQRERRGCAVGGGLAVVAV